MYYFDHAATSYPKPAKVTEAVCLAMNTMGNSGRAVHEGSLKASRIIFEAREKTAAFFGCEKPQNVAFTCNATEGLNMAIQGSFSSGDHIISTDLEHNSVLRPLYERQEKGCTVSFLQADSMGNICYDDLEANIRPQTKGIVCTHASNVTGNLLDLKRIGAVARKHHLLFVADVSQTAGVFPIDMKEMGIDILCFTGHKSLLGPQGTGGLCIRTGVEIRPLKYGGTGVQTFLHTQPQEMPTRLEAGTLNGHGIAGLSAALDYLNETGIGNIREHEERLMKKLYHGVSRIPGVKVYGDFSAGERAAIVSLNYRDVPSTELADELMEGYGIATRSGAHCAPRMHEALGTAKQGAVRFSIGYNTTDQEVEYVIDSLRRICQ